MNRSAVISLACAALVAIASQSSGSTQTTRGSNALDPRKHVQEALDKYHSGDADDAIVLLTEVLATTDLPDEYSAVIHSDRGIIYMSKHQWDKAIEDFATAIKLRPPGNPDAHTDLANAYHFEGRDEEALAEYEEAIKLQPSPNAYEGRGLIRLLKGHADK